MVRMLRHALRPLLLLVGAYHLLLGLVMVVAPRAFFEQFAAYGGYNDHYIRDVATFYLALGAVLLIAVVRTAWRVPLLAFATIQYALHVVNHLWDVADADPGWLGPANVASLTLIGVVLWWMLRRAQPPASPR